MRLCFHLHSTFLCYANPRLSPNVPTLKVSKKLRVSHVSWTHDQTVTRRFGWSQDSFNPESGKNLGRYAKSRGANILSSPYGQVCVCAYTTSDHTLSYGFRREVYELWRGSRTVWRSNYQLHEARRVPTVTAAKRGKEEGARLSQAGMLLNTTFGTCAGGACQSPGKVAKPRGIMGR